MRPARNKDINQLLAQLPDTWRVERTRKGHLVILGPQGQRVVCSNTPSDCRATANVRAWLRRVGAPV